MMYSWWARFLFLAGGITLARYAPFWIMGAVAVLIFLGIFFKNYRGFTAVMGICLMLGWMIYTLRVPPVPDYLQDIPEQAYHGTVLHLQKDLDSHKSSWILETDSPVRWKHFISMHSYYPVNFHEGDQIEVIGKLKVPRSPRNPGEFDYRRYLADQKIYYTMSFYQEGKITVIQPAEKPVFSLASWRKERIEDVKKILNPDQAGILLGMILGMKNEIPEEAYDIFQKTGIVHLMAVSGLHAGFVLLFSEFLLRIFKLHNGTKRILQMLLLFGYGFLTEWPVTIQRAVFMTGLAFLALQWGRNRNALDILGLTGFCILFYQPVELFSISFQLSFAAVWGILYIFPFLEEKIPWKNAWIKAFLLPVSVDMAILPIGMYYFQLYSVSSFLVNPIAVWLGAGIIWLGLLGFIFSSFGVVLGALFLYPASWILTVLSGMVEGVSRCYGSYFWTPQPDLAIILLYYLLITLVIFIDSSVDSTRKYQKILAAGAALVWLFMFIPHQRADGEIHLNFLDIGQGNCLVMQTPAGEYWMIDGGGNRNYQVGEQIVIPWMHREGIKKIDWMVNTHPDTDHLRGLEETAHKIPVKNLLLPASLKNAEVYLPLKETVYKQGGKIWYVEEGKNWNSEPGLRVEIWNPLPKKTETYHDVRENESPNEESIIMKLSWKDFSLLITGDAGTMTLENVLQSHPTKPVTVLQVPHHGSRNSYSRPFYEGIQAVLPVVQCGAHNSYGHPHSEVVEAFNENGPKLFRTDLDGYIRVDTKKEDMYIHCYLSGEERKIKNYARNQ